MSERFEDEVRSALRSGVGDELSAAGLADGARSRLRRRRRTTMSIVGAAALVAAVPVGITALNTGPNGTGDGQVAEALDQPAVEGLPAGWHWESYANVEFGVPDSWKHGTPNQWCVSGDRDQGWVSRPNEVSTLVACMDPTNGFGAVILDVSATDLKSGVWQYPAGGHEYPAGAWMTSMVAGDLGVSVAAPDQATAETIADSFRTFADGADANGCAPHQAIPQLGSATGLTAPESGPIVLCNYSGWMTGDNLTGSEPMSADRAQALLDALATAKDDGSGVPAAECFVEDPDAILILRGGEPLGWAFNTMCSESGVDLGDGNVLPMSTKVMLALVGSAPEPSGSGSGDGGVVTEDPDGSVSNDGTVVPPDQGSGGSSTGGGSSGSSGSEPGSSGAEGGTEGSTGTT